MKRKYYLFFLISLYFVIISADLDTLGQTMGKTDQENDSTEVDSLSSKTKKILVFDMKQQIAPAAWRNTQKAFEKADEINADYIIVHMNTYGGRVDIADSIRTKILNAEIPVFVFINNNAASAGALISIAADSIYMRKGSSIGAATVVNQSGEVVPDKYQSFMRSTMRATAETHGKDTVIRGNDTIIQWHRNPKIAEAMVDPSIYIEGIIDTGKVLTFTTEEAIKYGFCEGVAENIKEVVVQAGIENYEIDKYELSSLEKVIAFLLSPILQGLLIMLIIGGIYFELQTPGIGFPLGAAALAALLYFAPLYLEGLAQNWELIIFVVGILLIALEIFVIPGFGVAGFSGIVLLIIGLTLAMVDNVVFEFDSIYALKALTKSFFTVMVSMFLSLALSIYFSRKMVGSGFLSRLALSSSEEQSEGYISYDKNQKQLIGKSGMAYTVLRPSGKVEIDGELYDARSEIGYIEKGEKVKVIRDTSNQIYVIRES